MFLRNLGWPAFPFKRNAPAHPPLGKAGNTSHIGDMTKTPEKPSVEPAKPASENAATETDTGKAPKEIGGREGLDPTRYGDWEKAGRCVDF